MIIYLPCFDPCVLFCCLVFCSVSSSTERTYAQPLSSCSNRDPLHFCVLVRLQGALFEQLESGWAYPRSVEDEIEQKTRQQNKTQGSKQGKQIINQNICVLTPLKRASDRKKTQIMTISVNQDLGHSRNTKKIILTFRIYEFIPNYSASPNSLETMNEKAKFDIDLKLPSHVYILIIYLNKNPYHW